MKEIHLIKRINAYDLYLKRNEFDPFLKRLITGDEKWIVYNNVVQKLSWSKRDEPRQITSKAELHQKYYAVCLVYFLSCFQGTKRLIRMSTVVS